MSELEAQKKQAALRAAEHVMNGMLLGLGTGSTAKYAIERVGERLAEGSLNAIEAVVTSEASGRLARQLGIPLVDLGEQPLDLAIDGMDEVDDALNAIKGLGGALTREKIVESCTRNLILIGDSSKRVNFLGEKAPVPVEVVPFGWQATRKKLSDLGGDPVLREKEGEAFVTDNGNLILDCHFAEPFDAYNLATSLSELPGVVEHGLFLDMAALAYIATEDGVVTLGERP